MLIDISDEKTYPRELEQVIVKKVQSFSTKIKLEIESCSIEYNSDVNVAIEEYLGPRAYREEIFFEEVVKVMDKYEIVVYHATKVINKSFLIEGLNINDWESYSMLMKQNCEMVGMNESDVNKVLELIKSEYKRKYTILNEEPNICFFSGFELTKRDSSRYDQFCENIGGELAKRALLNYPNLYKLLEEEGVPYIVKFKFKFSKLKKIHKDIAYEFIYYYAAKYFWGYSYKIEFDSKIYHNVSKNDIIEVIPYIV